MDATQVPSDKPANEGTQVQGDDAANETDTPTSGLLVVMIVMAIVCIGVFVILASRKFNFKQLVGVAANKSEGGSEE